jgi:hypothetical protein
MSQVSSTLLLPIDYICTPFPMWRQQPSPVWDIMVGHLHRPLHAQAIPGCRDQQLVDAVTCQFQRALASLRTIPAPPAVAMEKNLAQCPYLYKRKIQSFLHTSCGINRLQPILALVLVVSSQSKNAARVTGWRGSRVVGDLVLSSRGSPPVAARCSEPYRVEYIMPTRPSTIPFLSYFLAISPPNIASTSLAQAQAAASKPSNRDSVWKCSDPDIVVPSSTPSRGLCPQVPYGEYIKATPHGAESGSFPIGDLRAKTL